MLFRSINKTGCPYCSHNKVLAGFNDLATLLPDIAAEWSDRNYPLLPTQVTVFANRKAWWKCKDCGREWNTLISTRCKFCLLYTSQSYKSSCRNSESRQTRKGEPQTKMAVIASLRSISQLVVHCNYDETSSKIKSYLTFFVIPHIIMFIQ